MNPKNYERLTTACLLLAVASALSFQSSGRFSALVGVLGIAAGVVAAVVYFKNQLPPRSETRPANNDAQKVPRASEEPVALTHKALALRVEPVAATEFAYVSYGKLEDWNVQIIEAPEYSINVNVNELCRPFYKTVKFCPPDYGFREQSQPDEVVGRVVEIMKRLSTQENMGPYECVLSRDGNFTIRPMLNDDSPRQDDASPSARDEEVAPYNLARPN